MSDGQDAPRFPVWSNVGRLVNAIREDDDVAIEAILRLSRSRRVFAPLAFTVGAFAMLLKGLRVLLSNWRLTLVQVLPAVLIWLAMFDLKVHVLHGKSFNPIRGLVLIPINLGIVALTVGAYLLNAVFAFAIVGPGPPEVGSAFARARRHLRPIVTAGVVVGLLLGFATTVVPRWGSPWFALCLSVVVGVMMISYLAVPSRLLGVKPKQSKRDKLASSAIGTALSTTVCTPPYILGRVGILMLGSRPLLIPGIFVLTFGFTLQAGATGAVSAIKMSATLMAAPAPGAAEDTAPAQPTPAQGVASVPEATPSPPPWRRSL
jgi:hypothetical protein